MKFNYEEISTAMLIRWIDNLAYIPKSEKALLLKISYLLMKDRSTLFKEYDKLFTEENHSLSLNDEKLDLSFENKKKILTTLIDFLEDILPLGSVVTLKNENLKDKEGRKIKIIISQRFLSNEKSGLYFTYSGTIYPTGNVEKDKLLHFNEIAIKEVIYKGYSDDLDLAFVLTMKNELILERGLRSITFANAKEEDLFKREISIREDKKDE